RALICAADCRMGEPDSMTEQNYGDAAAAVVLGTDAVIAEMIGAFTVSAEFLGTWRTAQQDYLHAFPGSFETKFGYTRFMTTVIKGVLQHAEVAADRITTA